jgi:hypothetical protein
MGTLNDRQFSFLRSKGYQNSLADMMTSWLAYSPANLFSVGEQGVWFDPSDVANLNWRRNLLTWTEQFDNAAWTKTGATVTANAAVAPDGTTTADLFIPSAVAEIHHLNLSVAATTTEARTATLRVKLQSGSSIDKVTLYPGGSATFANFNVATVSVSNEASVSSSSITALSDGWFLLTATWPIGVSLDRLRIYASSGSTGAAATAGNGTSGILIWGAQFELGSVATDYQRITDVNTEVIERFPTATLYQDTAGTTPVTTTGQSVGLMLDKSKGLVLGSELQATGFTGVVGTATAATYNTATGEGTATRVDGSNRSFVRFTTTATSLYRLTIQNTGSTVLAIGATVSVGTIAAGQTVTFIAGQGTDISIFANSNGTTATFTVTTVKELPGNHAVQATTANRPIYGIHPVGGRRNLLVRTEEFDNASWAKNSSNAVANSANDPTGAATGDTVRLNAGTALNVSASGLFTSSVPYVSQPTASALAAGSYTYSAYVKGGVGLTHVQFRTSLSASLNPSVSGTVVRLSDGAVVDGAGTVSAAGNGWWRVSLPLTATAAVHHCGVWFWNATSIASAVGTEGIYIWGAQLEAGSTATAYQRVTDQYNVTEAGVSSVSYLFFDGVNDSLATPTITPGTNKAQVFAGVRKLGIDGVVAELSASTSVNNGAFLVYTPGNNYRFTSRGTIAAIAAGGQGTPPVTSVVTGLGDISGDNATLRVNGTQAAQDTADQGTGNYLAYPLFIGGRNSASLFFSGHLYSLIARFGPNLDTGQISSTETWVASRTGITI